MRPKASLPEAVSRTPGTKKARLATRGELQAQLQGSLAGVRQTGGYARAHLQAIVERVAKIKSDYRNLITPEEREDLSTISEAMEEFMLGLEQAGEISDRIQRQVYERDDSRTPILQYVVSPPNASQAKKS